MICNAVLERHTNFQHNIFKDSENKPGKTVGETDEWTDGPTESKSIVVTHTLPPFHKRYVQSIKKVIEETPLKNT